MYLKSLIISKGNVVIRNIVFRYGLNIIVDDTISTNSTLTGNNVGKTTVLKLIYFCFGGKPDSIYKDEDSNGDVSKIVKDYLVNNNILVTLTLSEDLNSKNCKEIVVRRSFGKPRILSINEENCLANNFEEKLRSLLFPNLKNEKPTIKQLIGHNIRYKEKSLTNTLRFLDTFTTNEEYEALFLCLFGIDYVGADESLSLNNAIKKEQQYLSRLQKEGTLSQYRTKLAFNENRICELSNEKETIHLNDNYEGDVKRVEVIKETIGHLSSKRLNLRIKKDLIESSLVELDNELSVINLDEIKSFYDEVLLLNPSIHKTFEEMVEFHNKMIENKKTFISRDLPNINALLLEIDKKIEILLDEESKLSDRISKSTSLDAIKKLEFELYKHYEEKGKCEEMIQVIEQQQKYVGDLKERLSSLTDSLYLDKTHSLVQNKVDEFNIYFSKISEKLYGEKYLVSVDLKVDAKTDKKYYCFSTFNDNIGTGKKQGEILSFDLAYLAYAKANHIPAMFFLLNDKKELMHDNQLVAVCQYLKTVNDQLVVSMLRDKLPTELNKEEYFVLRLSPEDKLFRIENQQIEKSSK